MILLRSALFNAAIFTLTPATIVFGIPFLLAPPDWLRAYVRGWARLVLWLLRVLCGVRWQVTGAEHLPRDGAALIAAQHQSAFDTVVWHALLPRAAYVMKIELLRIPVWGALARRVGSVGVDRAAGASALRDLLRDGRAAAGRGQQIVIFPEGTRTEFGERRPWQPGVAALAAGTGLPLIPVATDAGRHWPRRSFRKRPGMITVAVLPPIPPGLPRAALLRQAEAAVATALAEAPADATPPVENPVESLRGGASGTPEESRPTH